MPCWPRKQKGVDLPPTPIYTNKNGVHTTNHNDHKIEDLQNEVEDLKKRLDQSYATVLVSFLKKFQVNVL